MKQIFSWQNDPSCNGQPYPKVFDEIKRILRIYRNNKCGKSPTNGLEILAQFENEEIFAQLGYSKLKDENDEKIPLFNDVVITRSFENCIFSSRTSISLIVEYVKEEDRFFILDGTFRITPKGVWKQVLFLHVNFGMKVSPIELEQLTRSRIFITFALSALSLFQSRSL